MNVIAASGPTVYAVECSDDGDLTGTPMPVIAWALIDDRLEPMVLHGDHVALARDTQFAFDGEPPQFELLSAGDKWIVDWTVRELSFPGASRAMPR